MAEGFCPWLLSKPGLKAAVKGQERGRWNWLQPTMAWHFIWKGKEFTNGTKQSSFTLKVTHAEARSDPKPSF